MANKLYDLTGQRFGRWTVIERAGNDAQKAATWLCRCDCGTERIVRGYALRYGHTQSCGCLQAEKVGNRCRKHGGSFSRLYYVWDGMKRRCYYPSNPSYKNYGGRGIKMCDEWHYDFNAFRDWAYANGYDENAPKDECTLDRIDVNGNYEPDNCRWANMKVQSNNRRSNRIIEYNGESHTISEWSEIQGFNADVLEERLRLGWDIERALTQTPRKRSCYKKTVDVPQ